MNGCKLLCCRESIPGRPFLGRPGFPSFFQSRFPGMEKRQIPEKKRELPHWHVTVKCRLIRAVPAYIQHSAVQWSIHRSFTVSPVAAQAAVTDTECWLWSAEPQRVTGREPTADHCSVVFSSNEQISDFNQLSSPRETSSQRPATSPPQHLATAVAVHCIEIQIVSHTVSYSYIVREQRVTEYRDWVLNIRVTVVVTV